MTVLLMMCGAISTEDLEWSGAPVSAILQLQDLGGDTREGRSHMCDCRPRHREIGRNAMSAEMEENVQLQELVRDLAIAKMRTRAGCEPAPCEELLKRLAAGTRDTMSALLAVRLGQVALQHQRRRDERDKASRLF